MPPVSPRRPRAHGLIFNKRAGEARHFIANAPLLDMVQLRKKPSRISLGCLCLVLPLSRSQCR